MPQQRLGPVQQISIHALREEGDLALLDPVLEHPISIHALREEGDLASLPLLQIQTYFYPRPPRGGRPICTEEGIISAKFLSTPSARRATVPQQRLGPIQQISIHALREEGDRGMRRGSPDLRNFYPRPPRGGRPHSSTVRLSGGAFLSTPSARRATPPQSARSRCSGISIHALREEGDPANPMCRSSTAQFLSTPSARRATSYSSC